MPRKAEFIFPPKRCEWPILSSLTIHEAFFEMPNMVTQVATHTHQPQHSLVTEPPDKPTNEPHDQEVVSFLRSRLEEAGFPTDNCFSLIMTTREGKTYLAGWTQDRWDKAFTPFDKTNGNNAQMPIQKLSARLEPHRWEGQALE